MNSKFYLSLLALPSFLVAQKDFQEINAELKSAVVYTSSAEIYYEKEVQLPNGKSTVVFTDLSPFIVENSVNVSVAGNVASILTVTEKINYTKEKFNDYNRNVVFQDSLRKMKKEKGFLLCKIDAAETEKSLLFKGEAIGGLSSRGVAVAEIEKASAFFSKRYGDLAQELFIMKEKEFELEDRIKKVENQLKESSTVNVKTTSEIIIAMNSKGPQKVKFNFKFLNSKAGWAPIYDFKYEGPQNPLQFVCRAGVFNGTGTAWNDISIKLSTADPLHGFSVPQSNRNNAYKSVKFHQVEVVNAIAEYLIPQQYSIPSDAKSYLLDVNAYSMPANFNYLLIPKLDPFGFLMAKIPGWNAFNLIPGTANIYNMGTYMGKTFLNTYADNDTLSLYLGKDKTIQAIRNEKTTVHSRFLIGNYATEETKVEMSIKNNSKEKLLVEVLDQVPVYDKDDNEKLSVFNIEKAIFEKGEGKLIWNLALQPGETVALNFNYEIKSPKESGDGYKPKKRKFRTISCPAF